MTLNEIRTLIAESDKTGRPIQVEIEEGKWTTLSSNEHVCLDRDVECYRVAPSEPQKPREFWVKDGVAIESGMREPDHYHRNGYVLTREVMEGEK